MVSQSTWFPHNVVPHSQLSWFINPFTYKRIISINIIDPAMLVVNEHGSRMGTPKNGQLILKIDLNLWAPMYLILSHAQITNLTTSWAAQKSSQVVPGFLSSL